MANKGIRFKDREGNIIYPCPRFPIGHLYLSTVKITADELTELYGGVWQQIKDVFLLMCGDIYENGQTGGEFEHKLTIKEMPSHSHSLKVGANRSAQTYSGGGDAIWPWYLANESTYSGANNTGGDQPHNNTPPFLAIYGYTRIA